MTNVHIHWTGPTEVIRREPDGTRWCFRCRARTEFEYTLTADVEPSYYDPTPAISCVSAHHVNGDLFPGRER